MKRGLLVPSVAVVLLALTIDAAAQLPVSVRVSGLYARQAATLTGTVAGTDVGEIDTGANALGAEVRFGLPVVGFDLGLHYLRHFGDVDNEFDSSDLSSVASLGLSANEFALFAEKHFELVPMSPVKPYLGVGASYARIELSSDLDVTDVSLSSDSESSSNVARLYAVGGVELLGGLGVVARAGYTFSGTYELESPVLDDVDAVAEVDYDGYYVSIGLSLFGI